MRLGIVARCAFAAACLAPAIAVASSAGAAALQLPPRCEAPAALAQVPQPFGHAAAELATGGLVRIAVLGSGSSAGNGVSAPENAYPAALKRHLQKLYPDAAFDVATFAQRGARVADMLVRLEADVLPLQPALVIWQIGVSDVVETVPLARFRRDLDRGLKLLRAADADVLLVDMQFSRYTELLVSPGEYLDQLRWISRRQGVALLRRYALMEHWIGTAAFDFQGGTQAEQQRSADLAHDCVAGWLARMIHKGIRMADKR